MRPTELHFRSPKEKTAEFNMPVVTKEGIILLPTVTKLKHPTFAKSKRFSQYEDHAKVTGYRVGPGSYSPEKSPLARSRIKGTHIYKRYHGEKDVTNNGYILVGNSMMFDSSFILPSRKSPKKSPDLNASLGNKGYSTFNRVSTASTPSKHRRTESGRSRFVSP